jgi:hypothetical protein
MSRKHYQAMAARIAAEVENLKARGFLPGRHPAAFLHVKKMAEIFSEVACADNANFDHERFIKACGIPEIDEAKALAALEGKVLADA